MSNSNIEMGTVKVKREHDVSNTSSDRSVSPQNDDSLMEIGSPENVNQLDEVESDKNEEQLDEVESDKNEEQHAERVTDLRTPIKSPSKRFGPRIAKIFDSGHKRRSVSAGISQDVSQTPEGKARHISVVSEEILISPDVTRPMLQTRPSSLSNLSMRSVSDFKPLLHSTIFGAVDSPDVDDNDDSSSHLNISQRSINSRGSETSGSSIFVQDSPDDRKKRQPFRPIVEESPNVSRCAAGRNVSGNSTGDFEESMEEHHNNAESVIIDDSILVSDDEEKENIEPGNVSVTDIEAILEKSLHHNGEEFNEEPIIPRGHVENNVEDFSESSNDSIYQSDEINDSADKSDEMNESVDKDIENEEDNVEMDENNESVIDEGVDKDNNASQMSTRSNNDMGDTSTVADDVEEEGEESVEEEEESEEEAEEDGKNCLFCLDTCSIF